MAGSCGEEEEVARTGLGLLTRAGIVMVERNGAGKRKCNLLFVRGER